MNKKKQKTYAFIDSQNLNLGTSKNIYKNKKLIYKGWKVDMKKFYIYLKNKYRVDKAFLFIGYIPEQQKMYRMFKKFGYTLIFKPTVKDHNGKAKGNVDAELVLYSAAKEFNNYDKAVVISGDGDFACLYEYLEQKRKLKTIIIPNELSESSLLKRFSKYKVFLQFEKAKVER